MSTPEEPDPVEQEFLRALELARDNDEARELALGLRQYREMYKWALPVIHRRSSHVRCQQQPVPQP